MAKTGIFRLTCMLLATLAVACGGSTEPQPPAPLRFALDQAQSGDLNNFSTIAARFSLLPMFGKTAIDPAKCTQTGASGEFVCAPVKGSNGFVHAMSYLIANGAGNAMPAFDVAVTDAVRAVVDIDGTERGLAAHHHSEVAVTGMLTGTRTLRALSVDHDTNTSVDGTLITDAIGTTRDVIFGSAGSRYPTSGSIVTDVTSRVTQTGFPPLASTTRYILTFTGDGRASTVEQFGIRIVRTCTIDLTGAHAPSCTSPLD